MISSERTFGIEIEMGGSSRDAIRTLQSEIQPHGWRFDDDGSIRDVVPNPVEIVSPILLGKDGEANVRDVCTRIKRLGFNADYVQCGLHVHLGADEFKKGDSFVALDHSQFSEFMASPNHKFMRGVFYMTEDALQTFYLGNGASVTNAKYRTAGKEFLKRNGESFHGYIGGGKGKKIIIVRDDIVKIGSEAVKMKIMDSISHSKYKDIESSFSHKIKSLNKLMDKLRHERRDVLDEVIYNKIMKQEMSLGEKIDSLHREVGDKQKSLADREKAGRYVVWVEDISYVNRLVTLLLFYVIFDDVFMGMLPESRRKGNMYCIPVSKTFTPEQILKVKTLEDFECLWYKDPRKNGIGYHKNEHYDDSRYHNVNFHSLWNRHGTIEIRSHSSTTNPSKILLWTALHQTVIDKIANGEISKDSLMEYHKLPLGKKATAMVALLGLPIYMEKYVRRMLNYFSNTNI